MKFTIELDLTKTDDGARCSVEAVGIALRSDLEEIDSIFVEDRIEVDETEYAVTVVSVTHHR